MARLWILENHGLFGVGDGGLGLAHRIAVSGLTLPASAFVMVSSACLITTGQLYAHEAEPMRMTSTAESTSAATTFIHRHSSPNRRAVSRRVEIFRGRRERSEGEAAVERFG
jgi:hypothetical protein